MTNFYKRLDQESVVKIRKYFMKRIAMNKKMGHEYKSLERELFLMTACLIEPVEEEYDWQKRKDLQ